MARVSIEPTPWILRRAVNVLELNLALDGQYQMKKQAWEMSEAAGDSRRITR